MKRLFAALFVCCCLAGTAQDSSMVAAPVGKKPFQAFSSEKAINANTPETVGKGKLAFKVTHNFGDIGGKDGGLKNFFGLDVATDIRIGFQLGLGKKFDLITARAKGAGLVQQLWELGFKYQLLQQFQKDPSHPLAIAFFANAVISSQPKSNLPDLETSYRDFGDRVSNVFQLILAKRFGNVSLQLNPTLVTRGLAFPYDQKSIFALGGAIRVPLVANRLNLLVDYFHPFRKEAVKDSFLVRQVRFYDPLGVGFEIMTPGHVFRLNFTNASQILENRFIPRTIASWGKGQFRWGFTISRNFRLWNE